ncbi:zinc-dependent peptidase [Flavobacterium sp. GSA192]|uniref:zinc-dependent peptidase n=1 Tax=Flavobacterium sp. GSA192 TaxID=2576304 RepID=UPI0015E323B8|nr:zinc-dependent peptidase [Flavobacterium sp. GSA192]
MTRYYTDAELNAELRSKGYFRLYAYQNQFEFLAVILEHFFETPKQFRKEHPELFVIVNNMLNFKEYLVEDSF